MIDIDISGVKKLKVLYVEDEIELQNVIVDFLKTLVFKVDACFNGLEALELFSLNKYDVIITDINMPKLNGIDLIKKIRESNNKIPIIVTTAYNEDSYLEQLKRIGISEYIMKPLDIMLLLKALVNIEPK